MNLRRPGRWLAGIILAGTLVRLILAWGIGLGIDESYMVAAGRGGFRLGYFDHPPIAWWLSNGAARLAGTEAGLAVRMPFIALFALSSWLMFRLTAPVFGPAAALWAVAAFNLSPVFGITSGGWVLPDGPLIAALLAAACCLQRAVEKPGWGWWWGAGACAGLAMLSKYSAVLTLAGAVLYLITLPKHRFWLARPQPYAAALLALLVFSPVLIWNAENGWASLAFQGGRAAAARFQPFGPIVTLAGESLFILPWIWAPMMLVWFRAIRTGFPHASTGPAHASTWLLTCLAAPPILLFATVSLWSRQVLFHWAAPGYLFLFPLLGAWLVTQPRAAKAAAFSFGLLAASIAFVITEIRFNWLPIPGDPALQARDWTELRTLTQYNLPIAATSWADTGKVAIGTGATVFCLNPDAREFRFSSTPPVTGDILIVAPRRTLAQIESTYGAYFQRIETLPPLTVGFTEIPVFIAYSLKNWPWY